MTTPLGQVTGELQDIREFSIYGSWAVSPVVSSAQQYTGGYSVRSTEYTAAPGVIFAASQPSLRMGCYWRHPNLAADYARLCLFILRSSSYDIVATWKKAGNGLAIAVNNVVRALIDASTIANFLTVDQWHHIGMTYRSGTGGKICFFFDGINVLEYASDILPSIQSAYGPGQLFAGDPYNSNALVLNAALTGGQAAIGYNSFGYTDDLYFDGDVSTDADPPPDRFLFSLANAAGASAQWTPVGQATNIACVDEAVPNDDSDYVKAESANLVDLYESANIILPTGYGIASAIPLVLVKRSTSGPTIKLVAADGVNANLESAEKTPSTSYSYLSESMPVAPDGDAWNQTKFNAAQFGIKSAGTF